MSIRRESTSKRVAAIAGRILKAEIDDDEIVTFWSRAGGIKADIAVVVITGNELKALAASALTQTADKPKRKRTKNVRRSK